MIYDCFEKVFLSTQHTVIIYYDEMILNKHNDILEGNFRAEAAQKRKWTEMNLGNETHTVTHSDRQRDTSIDVRACMFVSFDVDGVYDGQTDRDRNTYTQRKKRKHAPKMQGKKSPGTENSVGGMTERCLQKMID